MIVAKTFKTLGQFIFRYGLGMVFIWMGVLKFKNSEADYLKEILQNPAFLAGC